MIFHFVSFLVKLGLLVHVNDGMYKNSSAVNKNWRFMFNCACSVICHACVVLC